MNRVLRVVSIALALCLTAHGSPKYKVLHSFIGTDGSGPSGGVTLGKRGGLYGTTAGGGAGKCGLYKCGIVFQLAPHANGKWSETVLYSFQGGNDGADPLSSLILDAFGSIYGTATKGGAHDLGTAFELTSASGDWSETTLYSFCAKSGCEDGGSPEAGLAMDAAGNLYGTAAVAFELSPGSDGWNETVLHRFGVKKGDGAGPYAGLILDANGDAYGATEAGGTGCAGYGCGVVYELTPTSTGWKEIVLHRFDNNGTDGVTPGGVLVMDGSGSLYGTTETGGCCGGVVYKLTRQANGQWKETILYAFQGGASGNQPYAGVVMDKSGNLYGTTDGGGNSSGCGVIYKLAPKAKGKWKYTVLYTFSGGNDGCIPAGNLVLDRKGNLYGGTVLGGTTGNGVIFELTP